MGTLVWVYFLASMCLHNHFWRVHKHAHMDLGRHSPATPITQANQFCHSNETQGCILTDFFESQESLPSRCKLTLCTMMAV